MNTEQSKTGKSDKKPKIYFIIGTVLLAVMGIAWSLDASLDYLLFGAAAFFFFLYFWNKPRASTSQTRTHGQQSHTLKFGDMFRGKTKPNKHTEINPHKKGN